MKGITKTLYSAAAVAVAALLASSCILEHTCSDDDILKETINLRVLIKSCSSTTKSTTITAENEAAVNKLQVLVFSSNGTLDAYAKVENQDSLSLECLSGQKSIYAIVNGPDLDYIKYKDDLLTLPSYLSDNYTDSFVMWGTKTMTLSKSTSVSIPISRIVSKVTLSKITRDMSSTPAFRDSDLVIENIYMINVPGNFYLSGDVPSIWCNPSFNNYSCKDFLVDKVATALPDGESLDQKHTFYVYPNLTEKDTDSSSWSPRHTRLVVEVKLDGEVYYYPVTLPEIESNKVYNISELVLTRPGVDTPDLIISKSEVDAALSISEWAEALTTSASI